MADEMDPCECQWNHELGMRRLLNLLRQGQSYCTDGECIDDLPAMQGQTECSSSFLTMFLIMAVALAMYAMRPRRNAIQDSAKSSPNSQDRDGAPPTPPIF